MWNTLAHLYRCFYSGSTDRPPLMQRCAANYVISGWTNNFGAISEWTAATTCTPRDTLTAYMPHTFRWHHRLLLCVLPCCRGSPAQNLLSHHRRTLLLRFPCRAPFVITIFQPPLSSAFTLFHPRSLCRLCRWQRSSTRKRALKSCALKFDIAIISVSNIHDAFYCPSMLAEYLYAPFNIKELFHSVTHEPWLVEAFFCSWKRYRVGHFLGVTFGHFNVNHSCAQNAYYSVFLSWYSH